MGETPRDEGSSTAPPQHAEGMEYRPPPEPLTRDELFQLLMGLQSQNQTNERVITIADRDESKLPSPPEPKPYKGGNYQAYYNFCYQLDQYIEQKSQAFYNEERKITYGQRRLEGPIAASWTQHRLSVDMEAYTLKDFKQYLLNEIAPWGNRMRDAMSGLLTYSGRNESATRIMEKAQELSMIMGFDDEAFWANWMIAKAPSNVIYSLAQQGIAIKTLGEAKSRIEMITRASQAPKPQTSIKPGSSTANTKRPAGEEQPNSRPNKQANNNSRPPQATREKQQKEGRCFNCNGQGHMSRDCPQKAQSNQQ